MYRNEELSRVASTSGLPYERRGWTPASARRKGIDVRGNRGRMEEESL